MFNMFLNTQVLYGLVKEDDFNIYIIFNIYIFKMMANESF